MGEFREITAEDIEEYQKGKKKARPNKSQVLAQAAAITPDSLPEEPEKAEKSGDRFVSILDSGEQDGIWWKTYDPENGKVKNFHVSGPLSIEGRTRDSNGEGWGYLLKFRDGDKKWRDWEMPASLLSGDGTAIAESLLSRGLWLGAMPKAKKLLAEFIRSSSCGKRILCVSRIGWHGDAFVLPDQSFGGDGARILLQEAARHDHAFRVAGTLEEWQEAIGRKCSGNSRLVFALSLAFAPPLLKIMGEENWILSLTGTTSRGKTTILEAASSVWGGPGKSYMRQWRTTGNALETLAEQHNDALLVMDEIGSADPKQIAEIPYLFGNGTGKLRRKKDGGLQKTATFRGILLSTGELPIKEAMRSGGFQIRGGQEVRFVTLSIDAGKEMGAWEDLHGANSPGDFSNDLKAQAARFYGSPIRAFLEALARRDHQAIIEELKGLRAAFLSKRVPPDAASEVSRVAGRFALVALAGELAIDMGIAPWTKGEAIEAATACFEAWKKERGTMGSSDMENALNQIRFFLETYGGSRFDNIKECSVESEKARAFQRAGYRKEIDGESVFLITPQVFRQEVCKAWNYNDVASALLKQGHLIPGGDGKPYKKFRIPGAGKSEWAYHIKASILGGE